MIRFNDENEIIEEDHFSVILVGVEDREDITYSMEELAGLAEAAGCTVLGTMVQNVVRTNNATFIGKGKVEELQEMCENMEADTVVFNEELSGVQIRNLEDALGVRVIDRTILILDIFASRATSREGRLQVELAQLQYRMPRLTGFGKSLSRLGGGIGTRGPGEKKLETDRRHIAKRVDDIKEELAQAKRTRSTQRARREKNQVPVVAIVGYTNAGKSALLNKFMEMSNREEEKQVKSENILFATLDVQQRQIVTDNNHSFILIDTVGFVSKLPHSLVQAFKSTLEEVTYADLLIHLVDATYQDYGFHIKVTDKVLKEIGAGDKNKIMAYNKCDLIDQEQLAFGSAPGINISAKTGEGLDRLMELVEEKLFGGHILANLVIPYSRGDLVSYLCKEGNLIEMSHLEEGTKMVIELAEDVYGRVREYAVI